MGFDEDLEAELAAARRNYAASVPELLDTMSAALAAGNFDELRQIAHRVRGTAGCYGMMEVSDAAGAIEDVLSDTSDTWAPFDSAALHAHIMTARKAL